MEKGKKLCNHIWKYEREMTLEEAVKWRRTLVYKCVKCGKEKPGGLFLPPGPVSMETLDKIKSINKKKGDE